MSEVESQKYVIRDAQGNEYGPADGPTLREWVSQGRIVAGMHIAPRETREWVEVSQHPALADLFPASATPETNAVPIDIAPQTPAPVESRPAPARVDTLKDYGTVSYETPQPSRNTLSRTAMIIGIISPCLTVAGCIPLCGCILLPVGSLGGLTAIVLGIVALVQMRGAPEDPQAKKQAIIGISLGGLSLLLVFAGVVIGVLINLGGRP